MDTLRKCARKAKGDAQFLQILQGHDQTIFENVHDTLRGTGRITTNALEGLKVVDIIERIYASADRGLKA